MALSRIKVLEIAGLAPAPFCGMILSDFGADVVRVRLPPPLQLCARVLITHTKKVDRLSHAVYPDFLARGKRSIQLNLKSEEGVAAALKLIKKFDVLIEPFR